MACIEEGNTLLFKKEEDHELQIEFNQLGLLQKKLAPVIEALKLDGTIGENSIRNIHRTKEECTLQIINPDLRLTCPVIKATSYEQTEFELHIIEPEQLGIIADTPSPHRTRAFIVNKHSEIIRGKSMMVFNYKWLNDNTEEDKYPLSNKEELINKIKHTYIYIKFDLKSGF